MLGLLVAAPLAVADAPTAPATLDGHALGLAEGLLEYCTHADPKSVPVLQARLDELTKDTPEDEVVRLRKEADYRQAHDGITKFTGKVDPQNAKLLCSRGEPVAE